MESVLEVDFQDWQGIMKDKLLGEIGELREAKFIG
jgi:hypothetical protein